MKTNTAWLTQEELHRKWDVAYGTIKKWRGEGLPCYEVGKNICFLDGDVTAFIMEKKVVKPKVTAPATKTTVTKRIRHSAK